MMKRDSLNILLIGDRKGSLRQELPDACRHNVHLRWVDEMSAALSDLSAQRYHAVVMLLKPGGDAVKALRRIQAEASDTPVLIVADDDDADAALTAVREGAQDYLIRQGLCGPGLLRAVDFAIERNRTERRLMRLNQTLVRRVEERTGYVRLLQDIAIIANEADSVERALQTAVNRICRFMDWPVGHGFTTVEIVGGARPVDVWYLSEPEQFRPFCRASAAATSAGDTSLRGAVSTRRAPLWVMDVARDHPASARAAAARSVGLTTGFAFPVFVRQEVVALLEFFSTEMAEPGDGFLGVMAHVGTQLGRVVERRRLQQQLIEALWHRQRELGRDLHDGLGQELTGIGMLSQSLKRRLVESGSDQAGAACELVELICRSQKNLRRVSKGLMPVDLDAEGLRAALDELAADIESRCRIPCRFHCAPGALLENNHVATHLFRIGQEAVHNAVRHARPTRIEIMLDGNDHTARLQIRDDGVGIEDRDDLTEGIGLKTMKYRADVIDALLDIRPAEQGGTVVTCTIREKD